MENNKPVLKKTWWFEMLAKNTDTFLPQTEEGITEVKWIKPSEIDLVLKNTFQSVYSLISIYRKEK